MRNLDSAGQGGPDGRPWPAAASRRHGQSKRSPHRLAFPPCNPSSLVAPHLPAPGLITTLVTPEEEPRLLALGQQLGLELERDEEPAPEVRAGGAEAGRESAAASTLEWCAAPSRLIALPSLALFSVGCMELPLPPTL